MDMFLASLDMICECLCIISGSLDMLSGSLDMLSESLDMLSESLDMLSKSLDMISIDFDQKRPKYTKISRFFDSKNGKKRLKNTKNMCTRFHHSVHSRNPVKESKYHEKLKNVLGVPCR